MQKTTSSRTKQYISRHIRDLKRNRMLSKKFTLEERIHFLPGEIKSNIIRQFGDLDFCNKIAPWLAKDDPLALFERAKTMDIDVRFGDRPEDVVELMHFLVTTENQGCTDLEMSHLSGYTKSKLETSSFTRNFCLRSSTSRWRWWKTFLARHPNLSCRCTLCHTVFTSMRKLDIEIRLNDDDALWKKALVFRSIGVIREALRYLEKFPADMVTRVYMSIMRAHNREAYELWDDMDIADHQDFFHRLMAWAHRVSPDVKNAYILEVNLFFVNRGGDFHAQYDDDYKDTVNRLKDYDGVLRVPFHVSVAGPPVFSVSKIFFDTVTFENLVHTVMWMASHIMDVENEENLRFYYDFPHRAEIMAMPAGEEKCAALWQHGFYLSSGKWTWKEFFAPHLAQKPTTGVHGYNIYMVCNMYFTNVPTEEEIWFPHEAPGRGMWTPFHWEFSPKLRSESVVHGNE